VAVLFEKKLKSSLRVRDALISVLWHLTLFYKNNAYTEAGTVACL